MTSGAFTAAYLELIPQLELLTKKKIVTAATSIGTAGKNSIPNRLRHGEPVDRCHRSGQRTCWIIKDGLIIAESYTPIARRRSAMEGARRSPKPTSARSTRCRTLLQSESPSRTRSVSGEYLFH